jgi:hypothetical protein
MKTTIDIADSLLMKSRQVAKQEHVTLRQLVEEGLSAVVAKHSVPRVVHVKPVVFKGKGMAPEFRQRGWPAVRDALYGGHES